MIVTVTISLNKFCHLCKYCYSELLVRVWTHHICASTMGGSPDCMKKPLAWAPVMNPSLGPTVVNCSMCLILSWGRITHGSIVTLES